MSLLIIHRKYRHAGGEDFFLTQSLFPALQRSNTGFDYLELPALFSQNPVSSFFEILFMFLGLEKLRPSYFQIKRKIKKNQYSKVLFNNLTPTISLAVPSLCQKSGLHTYWWLHNARLSCANGLLYNGKSPCHQCFTVGSGKSLQYNCQGNYLKSFVYAFIYRNKRIIKKLSPFINKFICTSEYNASFLKAVLTKPDYEVIYHPAPKAAAVPAPSPSSFYLFLGRLSYEKGADLFIQMANKYPLLNFVMAGSGPMEAELKSSAPTNVKFLGQVGASERDRLFAQAEALLITSRVPENSPLVIFESHKFLLPIVYPKGGGAEEVVKLLGRSGCAIEDFRGQRFERKPSKDTDLEKEFDFKLKEIFGSLPYVK